ncbi:hypothetical protein ACRBEV_20080 [Methylobacterium phyllosphaerae]
MRRFDEGHRVGTIAGDIEVGMGSVGQFQAQDFAGGTTLLPRLYTRAQVDMREVCEGIEDYLLGSLDDRIVLIGHRRWGIRRLR